MFLSNKGTELSGNQEVKSPGCLFIYSDRGRKESMEIEKKIPEAAVDFHRNVAVFLCRNKTVKRELKEKRCNS